ncbi:MAG: type I DNA topoisomerase [Peptoniphilus sp.]|nr:type I DNA topoisomerase [Peptoniphilus sp.]
MTKNLVIVESPTKAKTIKKMLGSNYKVIASVGHVRDLPKSRLAIDVDNNFKPEYINIRGKGSIIKELKKESANADRVFLATDPDREGEAISWHLSHILNMSTDEKSRVTFNEITKDTIKKQIKNPRAIDKDLVDAQQARRILDRLTGYKISPLLWKKIKNGLSAGRVQSVALKIICDKEQEINEFVSEEYWEIEAVLKKSRKSFSSKYYGELKGDKSVKVEITDEKQADEILNKLDPEKFVIREIKKGTRIKKPAQPFTTSTMQQESSRKLNFTSRKTMMVAQNLYEGVSIPKEGQVGLITYMRTDSVRMSEDAKSKTLGFINEKFGENYMGKGSIAKKTQNVQDAHECIRPTDVNRTPESIKDSLSRDEFKLYNLIWKRTVASLMKEALYNTMSIEISNNSQIFRSSGSQIKFDGFLKVYNFAQEKDNVLPDLEENEILKSKSIEKTQHFTQPPARYNEATLIKKLEDLAIGRPSTYAPIVSTLLSRYYVVLEDKKLFPTELGIAVNDLLRENFQDLINEKFTANMENELDEIAKGNLQWQQLIEKFYKKLEKDLEIAEKNAEKVEIRDQETDVICDKCGRNMVMKMGRYGKFLACPGFPECRNTKPLIEKIGVKCPKCEDGDIVVKRSKKGRKFFGCSNYPECDFVSWNKPIDRKCPKCNSILTEMNFKNKKVIKCSNSTCDYRESQ